MFCPEQFIEPDNFVRVIDAFVDAIDLNSFGFRHVVTGEENRTPLGNTEKTMGPYLRFDEREKASIG